MKNNPDILVNLVKTQQEQMSQLIGIIQENGLGNQVNNITNTQNNIQQNIYMNVAIQCYGTEDYSKLDNQKVLELIRKHHPDFIPKMIEYIHANPDNPEYHNVFFDKNSKMAITYSALPNNVKTWIKKDPKEVSNELTERIQEYMHPTVGPYFNIAMQGKDSETANKIISISQKNMQTAETFEKIKESLSKLTNDSSFAKLVGTI